MSAPDPKLPDDIDALKAMVTAMAEQQAQVEARNADLEARNKQLEAANRQAEERIVRLTATIKVLARARFGRRSERLRAGHGNCGSRDAVKGLATTTDYYAKSTA